MSVTAVRATVLELLSKKASLDRSAFQRAELIAERTGKSLEQVLNQIGILADAELADLYAEALQLDVWNPIEQPALGQDASSVLAPDFLVKNGLVLLETSAERLVLASGDPLDEEVLRSLGFATDAEVIIYPARLADIRSALGVPVSSASPAAPDERRLEREISLIADQGAEGPGARLVADIFAEAIRLHASDIHFEPRRHDLLIRLRIDGRMVEKRTVPADLAQPAVSRIKVIANLDLGERRLPQDGRTSFVVGGRMIDVRVATSPTVFGESAVLRILDRASVPLDLSSLTLAPGVVETLRRASKTSHGIFLVTGPTGSGKTTTLYALLQTFAGSPKKVLSVEDPVEFHFEHVSQTQVAPHVGLTFASALRSFLRQDPDVILVGEIRDPETAAIAVQAAMTGHLVLASVHANDAMGVLPRLMDLGVEPFQLVAAFRGAVAQRLVRKLCDACAQEDHANEAERLFAEEIGAPAPTRLRRPVGCAACGGSGFKGRIAISEGFLGDEALVRAAVTSSDLSKSGSAISQNSFTSMVLDGFEKITQGLTTLEEVASAINA